MIKKVQLQRHNCLLSEWITETTKFSFIFSVVDSSLVGSPREKSASTYHKIIIGITFETKINWGWMNTKFEQTVAESDLLKTMFWYAKELIEEKLKSGALSQKEEWLIPDRYCPFELARIPDTISGFEFKVAISNQQVELDKFAQLRQEAEDTKQLIQTNSRELQKLEEQEAKLGIYVPPHICIDIEDRKEEDKRLRAKLADIESSIAQQDT